MFACPNCGGNMKFDISTQQLGCEFCQTQADPYSFEDKEQQIEETTEYDVTIFTCPQCGGEILSTDTSAAEFCTFCGASTILHSRLSKEKRPNYIIPFKQTKEDCKKAYSKVMKRAIFAPDELKDAKYIDGFRGIYIPYWAFYMTQQGPFELKGTRTHRRGDFIFTDHYALRGEIDAYYKGLSYDASSSFDDSISEKLAPFDVKGMKAFTPAYLSGFYADTADVSSDVYKNEAMTTAVNNSIDKVYGSFSGVRIAPANSTNILHTKIESVDNAMFPVWFMSYRNGDRVAYATVNGQTGRVVTDLPVDTKKYTMGSFILAIPIFILLNLFFTITPSTLILLTTVLSIISLIILSSELSQIKRREAGLNDRGKMSKMPAKTASNAAMEKPKNAGRIASIIAIIVSILVWFFNPISDVYYYAGSILTLGALFFSIKDIIQCYNILATRRLPQFDRTGGDDRA